MVTLENNGILALNIVIAICNFLANRPFNSDYSICTMRSDLKCGLECSFPGHFPTMVMHEHPLTQNLACTYFTCAVHHLG